MDPGAPEETTAGSRTLDTAILMAVVTGGVRMSFLSVLLAVAARAAVALVRLRFAQREPEGMADTLVAIAVFGSLIGLVAIATASALRPAVREIPALAALPWLLIPWLLTGLLASCYLGNIGRTLRVFASCPASARRLALDPRPVRRQLAMLSLAAAAASGLVAAELTAEELAAAVAVACGVALWFEKQALAVPLICAAVAGGMGGAGAVLLTLAPALAMAAATAVVLSLGALARRFGIAVGG